jgi:hypothetical protein
MSSKIRSMAREIARHSDIFGFEECFFDDIEEASPDERRLCPKCRAAATKAAERMSEAGSEASDSHRQK